MISIFDRISAIARGDVVGGSNSLIDSIDNHGRRVLEYQYSRGLFQHFPVDDRCARKETLRGKTKKVGHKGGRGGINAQKRRKLDIDNEGSEDVHDDVHLGDEDHLVEGGDQEFTDFFVGQTSTHDLDEVPNVDLLAPCPHPTFDCADSDLPPPQQHSATTIVRPSPSSYVPSFRLLASNDFLIPHLVEQHDQQPSKELGQQQQAPAEEFVPEPAAEEITEEPPVVEQLQEPIEEQQEAAHEEHPMRLRTRKRHPPKCGTDGIKKVPDVKNRYERTR
ncbi:hypothetical protein POM88_035843 [Heracleum sosnowskyi]|uniref:Uncharacterized protein n=1 Tax=Heracleum sosnowskyi TaxID=360622 RepID=A0AAD8MDN1_9APIA|nr:hypothetical protein POM88_035843 [Heracleum sosnowskyi]